MIAENVRILGDETIRNVGENIEGPVYFCEVDSF